MRKRARLWGLVAVAAVVLSACWVQSGTAYRTGPWNWPAADPGVIVRSSTYYRFTTNANGLRVPVSWTNTPTNEAGWPTPVEALRTPAAGAVANYWAPEAALVNGVYYLFYSASINGSSYGEHAIYIACSSTGRPEGPYDDCGNPSIFGNLPVVRDPSQRGAIDPDVVWFNGSWYLLWSVDWGRYGRGSSTIREIRSCRLAANLRTCASGQYTLLRADRSTWELGTVENPAMIPGGDGNMWLFYSGGNYENAYATGVATCTSPVAACTRLGSGPWAGDGWNGLTNPGGADFVPVWWGVYSVLGHAGPDFNPAQGDPRRTYFTQIGWQS